MNHDILWRDSESPTTGMNARTIVFQESETRKTGRPAGFQRPGRGPGSRVRPIGWPWYAAGFALILALLCLPLKTLAMEPETKVLYEKGLEEMKQGHGEAGLDFFEKALKIEPYNLSLLISKGQALALLKRYDEAEGIFRQVMSFGVAGERAAVIEIASVHAQQERYAEAAAWYTKGMELNPRRADLYLARGSMYMHLKDDARALADYRQAACQKPELAATAMFYEGILYFDREDLPATKDRLNRALCLGPTQELADQIKKFQKTVAQEEKARKSWEVNANGYLFYDDNVPMEPLSGFETFGSPATDKSDNGYGIRATGTYYFLNSRKIQTGLDYTFWGTFYGTLTEYDYFSHTGGLFLNYGAKPWFFRVRGETAYYYADNSSKVVVYALIPAVARLWSDSDKSEVVGYYAFKSSRDETDDINRYVLNATHYHTFIKPKVSDWVGLTARGGWRIEHEAPLGDRGFNYLLNEINGGIQFPLPGRCEGDVGAGYGWADFQENDYLLPGLNRKDTVTTLTGKFGRKMTDNFRLDFLWVYTHNDSNLSDGAGNDPFEYRRNVYTLMFSGKF